MQRLRLRGRVHPAGMQIRSKEAVSGFCRRITDNPEIVVLDFVMADERHSLG